MTQALDNSVKHVYASEKVLLQVLTKASNMLNVLCIFHIINILNNFCACLLHIQVWLNEDMSPNLTSTTQNEIASHVFHTQLWSATFVEVWMRFESYWQMGRFSASNTWNCEICIHVLHLAIIYIHLANAFIQSHYNRGTQKAVAWLQMTSKVHDHSHTHRPQCFFLTCIIQIVK